jgi:hypothetical protein
MTSLEAEIHISKYRSLLKAWTMAVSGFSSEDSDALYRQLEQGQELLAQIALECPEKSYSIDMLVNSRSRTWPGFAADRIPRPSSRHP